MRKLIGALLALGMVLTGFMGVAAQDAGTSLASGVGTTATWTDERGNPMATLEVTEVVSDWSDYDEYYAPERGYTYVAVNFTVTNIGNDSIVVDPYSFSMLDSEGANTSRTRVNLAEGATTVLLEEEADVAAGESIDGTLVFGMYTEIAPALFIWQPESGKIVAVDLSDGASGSLAQGMNAPTRWISERGDEIATFEVVDINTDWQDYDEYSAPERGSTYLAVTIVVTNTSDADIEVTPYNFSVIDTESSNLSTSWVSAADGAETSLIEDTVVVAPGESLEGTLVFSMYSDLSPVAMMWQPEYGRLSVVILAEGDAPAGTDATPTTEDVVATPAN